LIQEGLRDVDPDQRLAAYAKAQELIWNDAPHIFLYAPTYFAAINNNAGGVVVQPDGIVFMRTAFWKS